MYVINIFKTGGVYGRGRAPPVTAKGSANSSPSEAWGEATSAFFFAFMFISSMKMNILLIHSDIQYIPVSEA